MNQVQILANKGKGKRKKKDILMLRESVNKIYGMRALTNHSINSLKIKINRKSKKKETNLDILELIDLFFGVYDD